MKPGMLPPRDSVESDSSYNHANGRILVEINGQREELSLADAMTFANKILTTVEVVIRNAR